MPKYFNFMICGYYLYFTSHCVIEAMHAHANKRLVEQGAAKFFVKSNGDTTVEKVGMLSPKEVSKIRTFIKDNYEGMFRLWQKYSEKPFYND